MSNVSGSTVYSAAIGQPATTDEGQQNLGHLFDSGGWVVNQFGRLGFRGEKRGNHV